MQSQSQLAYPTGPAALSPDEQRALMELVSCDRDKGAFATLFTYFAPRVKSYVMGQGCDDAMAEGIAQQTLLQVWQKADSYNAGKGALSTWIFRIARNRRIDLLRKERHFEVDDSDPVLVADEDESPENNAMRTERQLKVQSALHQLPPEQAFLVKLSFFDGLSHGEIAEQHGIPLGTVKSRLRLALAKLRTHLEDLQ